MNDRKTIRLLLLSLAVVVFGLGLWRVLNPNSTPAVSFRWLTRSERQQANLPTPWTRFKWSLQRWLGPAQRLLPLTGRPVLLTADVFAVPLNTAQRLAPGTPTAAEPEGRRAWLLSADALK